ncbi:MAG TPA: hypothetical protein QF753_12230 [Victivallales bacterium]|nr:hypothetical protein [Victivallales bacterium]
MNKLNQFIEEIDPEEAAAVTGAISEYLGHKNFTIKSARLVSDDELSDSKDNQKKKFSFSTWRIQN